MSTEKPKALRIGSMALKCSQDERGEIADMEISERSEIHVQLHSVSGIRKVAAWLNAYCDWRERMGK